MYLKGLENLKNYFHCRFSALTILVGVDVKAEMSGTPIITTPKIALPTMYSVTYMFLILKETKCYI